jgi:TolB-like protein/tetratricopeptide (TPR) repeat protein
MINRFLNELRHRRVLRTAVAYAVIAAAIVEFTDIVTPALDLPEDLLRGVILVALVGFPVILVLAWFFDLTSSGVVRGESAPESSQGRRALTASVVLISLLALAVAYLGHRLYQETRDEASLERGMSIAVLPFDSISAGEELETVYFSDGISEEILNALSGVEGLRVAARTSSFALRENGVREVGESLDVSVVLQGTVRRAGDRLRISAQLVDTDSGFQLWSEVYDHELKDVFLIQEQIANAIVKSLRIEVLEIPGNRLVSPGTENSLAYDKYLEGRNVLQARTPSAARLAISIFEEALELDPDYAQAYAGLADSWIVLREVGNLSLLEATQQSHTAITKALQLNVGLPEAQASLGLCILGGGDMSEAGLQFQKAIELDPEYSEGYLLRAKLLRDQGYLAQAIPVFSQALALDPLNPAIIENQALLLAYQGRFDSAIEQLTSSGQRNPGRLTGSLITSRVWALAGDGQKALEYARRAADLAPDSPVALAGLIDALAGLQKFDQAMVILDRMNEIAPNNETAIKATLRYYLAAGDFDSLNALAVSRAAPFIGRPGWRGSPLLFERVAWAAIARMALEDVQGAREFLEEGVQAAGKLDPQPAAVHTLNLMARVRRLDGDAEGAAEMEASAAQLMALAQAEGWNELAFANYDPVLAQMARPLD